MANVKKDSVFVKHATNEGVFVKNLFCKNDTDACFNSMEVVIVPNFEIKPHMHENSTEYFYVLSGTGECLIGSEWESISKGDVFKAPEGVTHAIKNTGKEMLVMYSIFSPAIR